MSSKTFSSKCHFDAGLFSEPLAIMNLLWEYENVQSQDRDRWCRFHGVFPPRIRRLASSCENLTKRVCDFVGVAPSAITVDMPPVQMPEEKLQTLRIIQAWVFHEAIIKFNPKSIRKDIRDDGNFVMPIENHDEPIQEQDLLQVLSKKRHSFEVLTRNNIRQNGMFERRCLYSTPVDFIEEVEERLISFCIEKEYDCAVLSIDRSVFVYVKAETLAANLDLFSSGGGKLDTNVIFAEQATGKKTGRGERACGQWRTHRRDDDEDVIAPKKGTWAMLTIPENKSTKGIEQADFPSLRFSCTYNPISRDPESASFAFDFRCNKEVLREQDLKDMFASGRVTLVTLFTRAKQEIILKQTPYTPLGFQRRGTTGATINSQKPLLKSIPEAARLLSSLVSARRRETVVKLQLSDAEKKEYKAEDEEEPTKDVRFGNNAKIASRWKRHPTGNRVYLDTSTPVASVVPLDSSHLLYCCCANTLDIAGGALKAEGLTLLPQGSLFHILCRLTFGAEGTGDEALVQRCMSQVEGEEEDLEPGELSGLFWAAVLFDEDSKHMGESLVCFPDRINALVDVFRMFMGGPEARPWDLSDDPFLTKNLKRLQREKKRNPSKYQFSLNHKDALAEEDKDAVDALGPSNGTFGRLPSSFERFEDDEQFGMEFDRLFSIDNPADYDPEKDILSTKYLTMLVERVRGDGVVHQDFDVFTVEHENREYYFAVFKNKSMVYTKRNGKAAAWLKQTDPWKARPSSSSTAMECVPNQLTKGLECVTVDSHLVFPTLEMALRMESAFWLERQLLVGKKHWYRQDPMASIQKLQDEMKRAAKKESAGMSTTENTSKSKGVAKSADKPKVTAAGSSKADKKKKDKKKKARKPAVAVAEP